MFEINPISLKGKQLRLQKWAIGQENRLNINIYNRSYIFNGLVNSFLSKGINLST
tara:strand:+ start:18891 stop:19055 length:165 start_codon:yes stop_codon:yes gene_type:complete